MKYWMDEKIIVKVSTMSNTRGNQKKPSKYGRHAGVEAALVRSFILGYESSIKCFFFASVVLGLLC